MYVFYTCEQYNNYYRYYEIEFFANGVEKREKNSEEGEGVYVCVCVREREREREREERGGEGERDISFYY